jgi:hypothetical protein
MEYCQIYVEWSLLTKSQRYIFMYLQHICRNYKIIFYSVPDIAKACNCCPRTVGRALSLFKSKNWISKVDRPYICNIYSMNKDFLNLNFSIEKNYPDKVA